MNISTPTKKMAMAILLAATVLTANAQEQDTTVVVPELGVLPIKPSRNFTGPADVIVCSCFDSKSSGLYFTKYVLNTVVVGSSTNSSSALFLVAKPGTYTLTLTDAEVTGKVNTTSVNWLAGAGTAFKEKRYLYKYTVKDGKPGFERDEKYAAENYQHCDLAEGEHIYLPLAENNLAKIAELLNTTIAGLQFIPFNGPWKNVPTQDEIATGLTTLHPTTVTNFFNLQGLRVIKPSKGIYVKDNKKVILK